MELKNALCSISKANRLPYGSLSPVDQTAETENRWHFLFYDELILNGMRFPTELQTLSLCDTPNHMKCQMTANFHTIAEPILIPPNVRRDQKANSGIISTFFFCYMKAAVYIRKLLCRANKFWPLTAVAWNIGMSLKCFGCRTHAKSVFIKVCHRLVFPLFFSLA